MRAAYQAFRSVSFVALPHPAPVATTHRHQKWGGKHEVARRSICAFTPSAVKTPTLLCCKEVWYSPP